MSEHLIDRKPLPRAEELRVFITDWRARHYVHLRKFYPDASGRLLPGKGLAIDVRDAPWLLDALQTAVDNAREAGFLAGDDPQV